MKQTPKILVRLCTMLSLVFCFFLLGTKQAIAQQPRKIETEKVERAFYIDEKGKKKYFPNTKTQQVWDKILSQCPKCLAIAEDNNINIWQNTKYIKKQKEEIMSSL